MEIGQGSVLRTDADGLVILTLHRPEKLNSLTVAMFADLARHLDAIEQAGDTIGAVVLRGSGRCFSAGNDISGIGGAGDAPDPLYQAMLIDRLAALPQPVVAAVHGYCFTGALELALAADFILASANAVFADTHARFGLTPLWGMSQRLPRRIGQAGAREMMFSGRRYSAAEAQAMGLVNHVHADDAFDDAVAAMMRDILANSWQAHRFNKAMMTRTAGLDLTAGLAVERDGHPGVTDEARGRLAGFGAS